MILKRERPRPRSPYWPRLAGSPVDSTLTTVSPAGPAADPEPVEEPKPKRAPRKRAAPRKPEAKDE